MTMGIPVSTLNSDLHNVVNIYNSLLYSCKKKWRTSVLFVGPLLVVTALGIKVRVDPLTCVFHRLHAMGSSDSPLVRHLLIPALFKHLAMCPCTPWRDPIRSDRVTKLPAFISEMSTSFKIPHHQSSHCAEIGNQWVRSPKISHGVRNSQ